MGLRLYGVTLFDAHSQLPADGIQLVPLREIAAVVTDAAYVVASSDGEEIQRYQDAIAVVSARGPVLPAPIGVVFRSRETLVQWMEVHYVTLSEALAYVEDRIEARVHVARGDGKPNEREAGADLAAAAAESFRVLRRGSVAYLPLRTEHMTGIVVSAAFLIDRELWKGFTELVNSQRDEHADLRFEMTGPWPPYDFVRMQFGG